MLSDDSFKAVRRPQLNLCELLMGIDSGMKNAIGLLMRRRVAWPVHWFLDEFAGCARLSRSKLR